MMSSTEVKLTKKNSCTSGTSSCKTQIQYIFFSFSFEKLSQKSPRSNMLEVSDIISTLELIYFFYFHEILLFGVKFTILTK